MVIIAPTILFCASTGESTESPVTTSPFRHKADTFFFLRLVLSFVGYWGYFTSWLLRQRIGLILASQCCALLLNIFCTCKSRSTIQLIYIVLPFAKLIHTLSLVGCWPMEAASVYSCQFQASLATYRHSHHHGYRRPIRCIFYHNNISFYCLVKYPRYHARYCKSIMSFSEPEL